MRHLLRHHWQAQLYALLLIGLTCTAATVQAGPVRQRASRCSSLPTARAARAGTWPLSCANATVTSVCRAKCRISRGANSSSSSPSTLFSVSTCLESGRWSQPTACSSNSSSSNNSTVSVCSGMPQAMQGATWACSSSSTAGTVCRSSCSRGYTGSGYTSTCLPSGRWQAPRNSSSSSSSSGGCSPLSASPSTITCAGLPQPLPDAQWDAGCSDATIALSTCTAACNAAAGFQGPGYAALCSDTGQWAAPVPTGDGCTPAASSNNNSDQPLGKQQQCSGSPPAIPGVAWEPCDVAANGARCTGFCQAPYRGQGYGTCCNASGEWEAPKKQLKNDVGCVAVSCAGAMPADVSGGAKWDPLCQTADGSKAVCFAFCESGSAAYMAECRMDTGTWTAPFKLGDCAGGPTGSATP